MFPYFSQNKGYNYAYIVQAIVASTLADRAIVAPANANKIFLTNNASKPLVSFWNKTFFT